MTADVRVRFTAEDVAEVLAAMQAVQNKAKATGRGAAGGITDLSGALGGLKSILGQVAGIVSAGVFINMVRQTGEGAETVQKLSRELATSTARMAALGVAARLADTDLQSLAPIIAKIAVLTEQASNGESKPAGALRALGLDPKQLQQMDAVDRALALSGAIAKTEDGPKKLTALWALFGKQTQQNVLILQELRHGLEDIERQIPGVLSLYSGAAIASASDMNQQFKNTSIVVQGLMLQFTSGFGPAIVAALQSVDGELVKNKSNWQDWGDAIGRVTLAVTSATVTGMDTLHTQLKNIGIQLVAMGRAAAAAASGNNLLAQEISAEAIALTEANNAMSDKRRANFIKDLQQNYFRSSGRGLSQVGVNGEFPGSSPKAPIDLDAIFQKQAALERAKTDQEIALIRARAKLAGDVEQDSYERGLTAVRAYYDRRRDIVSGAINAEILKLQQREVYVRASNPDQVDADKTILDLENRIALLRLQSFGELQKLNVDERKAVEDIGQKRLATERDIMELRGRAHEARLRQIDEEIAAESRQPGAAEPGRGRQLERKRTALIGREDLDQATSFAQVALDDLARGRAKVQSQVDAGLLSQLQGEQRVLDLEKQSLDTLRLRRDMVVATAAATGDPEAIRKAQEFSDQVDQIELNVRRVTNVLGQLTATGIDAATNALDDFFSKGIFQAKSWSDALRAGAYSVASAMQAVASKMLSVYLMQKLLAGISGLGALFGGGGGAGTLVDTGAVFAAEGGRLSGSGSGTSDSNLAVNRRGRLLFWSDGEYMMPSKRVSAPGAKLFLDRFRARGMDAIGDYISDNAPYMAAAPRRRYALGTQPVPVDDYVPDTYTPMYEPMDGRGALLRQGLEADARLISQMLEARGGEHEVSGAIEVHHDDSLIVRQVERVMGSGKGRDITLKTVAKNRNKFNKALGNG